MATSEDKSLKFAVFLISSLLVLHFFIIPIHALKVGVQANSNLCVRKKCSRKCESSFCKLAPFLRYGKYCGILYSGCPGEKPCDELDACCMNHDGFINSKNDQYLSQECNGELLTCIQRFKKGGGKPFHGNTCHIHDITKVISSVMNIAVYAGRFFHKP